MPPEAPALNDPAARTATGEIKDQSNPNTNPETKPEVKEPEKKEEPKVEPKTGEDGKTLLTEGDKDAKGEKKEAPAGPPEKYDFKAPEGWEAKGWELDPAVIEKAVPIFKELGLSNEAGQKLVNLYAAESAREHEAAMQLVVDQRKEWVDAVKADPDLGSKLPEIKTGISKAIDSLGPELAKSFRAAMDLTGAGDNPAFIKGFWKLAQPWIEGKHVPAGGQTKEGTTRPGDNTRPSAAKALYPSLP